MAPVQVDDDGNGHRRFRSGNGDNEQSKENTVKLLRVEIFVEGYKIDVDTIETKFNRHEHRNEIAACEQAIHPDKEKGRTYKQHMGQWNGAHDSSSSLMMIVFICNPGGASFCSPFPSGGSGFTAGAFIAITIQPIMAASSSMLTTSKGKA